MTQHVHNHRSGVEASESSIAGAARPHDHGPCLTAALDRARTAFDGKGMKLTPLRQRVFEEIAGSHDALGAYDVLDRMARKSGDRLAPISVYRAIDALLAAGVVHRIESKNAFFACHAPHHNHERHIALVCERCQMVMEVPGQTIFAALDAASAACGFKLSLAVAEGAGLCPACATAAATQTDAVPA